MIVIIFLGVDGSIIEISIIIRDYDHLWLFLVIIIYVYDIFFVNW